MLSYEDTPTTIKNSLKSEFFLDKIFAHSLERPLNLSVQFNFPLIAIGAPVRDYLPKVEEKLHCELIIPEHSEVANAVGAATGKVVEIFEALIRPAAEGGFILHSPWERKVFEDLTEAKKYARKQFEQAAIRSAENAGAAYYEVTVNFEDEYLKTLYLDTKVQAVMIGRPKWFCADEG